MIARLRLQAKAKLLVGSVTAAPERRQAYGYSLGLFCNDAGTGQHTLYVIPHEFVAPWFIDNGNFDVLLGMDILSQGRLLFEKGAFSFAFNF